MFPRGHVYVLSEAMEIWTLAAILLSWIFSVNQLNRFGQNDSDTNHTESSSEKQLTFLQIKLEMCV